MKIIRLNYGYMVEQDNGDYLCDVNGDNLWDTHSEAEAVIAVANGGEPVSTVKTWKEFNRMHSTDNFYGCIAPDGEWFDSGMVFTTAVSFCCYNAGYYNMTLQEEAEWMNTEGLKLGYSIVHSSMLKKMFEKGLLK